MWKTRRSRSRTAVLAVSKGGYVADFRKAFLKTGGNEGGSQHNPGDKGNLPDLGTYKGVAPRSNPNWRGWAIIKAEMNGLTPQPEYGTPAYRGWVKELDRRLDNNAALQRYVIDFFKSGYWDKYRLDEVTDQSVAEKLYDRIVNAGGNGVKIMQRCVGVEDDGVVGPDTLHHINSMDPTVLLQRFKEESEKYYTRIVENNPSQNIFLASWLSRC